MYNSRQVEGPEQATAEAGQAVQTRRDHGDPGPPSLPEDGPELGFCGPSGEQEDEKQPLVSSRNSRDPL